MGRKIGTGEGQENSRERDVASIQEATNPIAPLTIGAGTSERVKNQTPAKS